MRRELARVVLGGFWSQDGSRFQPVAIKGHPVVTITTNYEPQVGDRVVVEEYQPGAWRLAERQLAGVG